MISAQYNESVDRNLLSEMRIARNRKRREAIVRRQVLLLVSTLTILIFVLVFMIGSVMSDAQSESYEPQFKYYKSVTVHADETIWDIASDNYYADKYRSMSEYITEICRINNIGDPDLIKSGESLIIPYYSPEYK